MIDDEIANYGQKLLHEIHFWQINIHLIEKECEKQEKRILDLWNRVIEEIDQRQQQQREVEK